MPDIDFGAIKAGDRITFRAPVRMRSTKATRVVSGFDAIRRPLVRYHGWGDFVVDFHEVIQHHPKGA